MLPLSRVVLQKSECLPKLRARLSRLSPSWHPPPKTANRISPNEIGGIKEKYDFRFELGTTIWLYGSQLVLDTSTTGCDAVNSEPQRVVYAERFAYVF